MATSSCFFRFGSADGSQPHLLDNRSILSTASAPTSNMNGQNGSYGSLPPTMQSRNASDASLFEGFKRATIGRIVDVKENDTNGSFMDPFFLEPSPLPVDPDAILAKGMNALSIHERGKAMDDVHGVADAIVETPELIAKGLHELQKELEGIPLQAPNRRAYDLAVQQSPEFVSDPKLRLFFLRAEEFKPNRAAYRILRFFDEKMIYFGESKLTKHITLDDMDDGDRECIRSGLWQVLPKKDRSGRGVMMTLPKMRGDKTIKNKIRAYYYMSMTALYDTDMQTDDESTQKLPGRHQFIHIFYHMGKGQLDQALVRALGRIRCALPLLIKSDHMVFNNPMVKPIITTGMLLLDIFGRVRVRFHCGTDLEAQYNLMSFGIPIRVFPVASNGEMRLENHHAWFQNRQRIESEQLFEKSMPAVARTLTIQRNDSFSSNVLTSTCDVLDPADDYPYDGIFSSASSLTVPRSGAETKSDDSGDEDGTESPTVESPRSGSSIVRSFNLQPDNSLSVGIFESSSVSPPPSTPIEPTDDDVMFGRGKPIQNRRGNVRFRTILDEFREAYDAAERFEKSEIAKVVLRKMKDSSGRFIKRGKDGSWYEVNDTAALIKLGHAFRTRRRAVNRARNSD